MNDIIVTSYMILDYNISWPYKYVRNLKGEVNSTDRTMWAEMLHNKSYYYQILRIHLMDELSTGSIRSNTSY